jgi:hypothetical protein
MTQIQNAQPAEAARSAPTDELTAYRAQYPVKPMQRAEDNAEQLRQMLATDGMHDLPSPPAQAAQFPQIESVPRTRPDAPTGRHLWVIRPTDMPAALEACAWGQTLESGCIKHSNLTGGEDAHSGGEMWFSKDDHVAINAASGRYGAQSEEEFDLIVDALRRAGYYVASTGFDIDNHVPNRIFVGDPEWQEPL